MIFNHRLSSLLTIALSRASIIAIDEYQGLGVRLMDVTSRPQVNACLGT